jgi:hypothetical protein
MEGIMQDYEKTRVKYYLMMLGCISGGGYGILLTRPLIRHDKSWFDKNQKKILTFGADT